MSSAPAIVVASAARTAVGSFNGAFATVPAHELGAAAIKEALARAKVEGAEVDEVVMGQILSAGEGQNPARQAAMKAGIPQETTAWGLNQLCGSGLRAIAIGMQQIQTGDAAIIVAGGQESMSMAPHAQHLRQGVKMGDLKLIDTMIKDGLTDAFYGYHMGNTAEIVPFTIKGRKGDTVVDADEYIRHGATLDAMAKLRPAFDKEGTVTAGNASGINDGAAAVVLMTEDEASRRGITPLVRIVSWATAGVDPQIMGTGPIPASRKALEKAGWSVADVELVEANEAFAAQACAVNKDMGWNPDIVNVNGGAIAIGHPIGASGARVFNTLVYEMRRRGAKKGLATLCIGGGMGVAMCVEAMN